MSDAGWLSGDKSPDERKAAYDRYLAGDSSSEERASAYRDGISILELRKRLAGEAVREHQRQRALAEVVRASAAKKADQDERHAAIAAVVDPMVDDALLERLGALRTERNQTYVQFFSPARSEPDIAALTARVEFSYGDVASRLRILLLAYTTRRRGERMPD